MVSEHLPQNTSSKTLHNLTMQSASQKDLQRNHQNHPCSVKIQVPGPIPDLQSQASGVELGGESV